jgi:type IX secretion system PorP/SprF family membrane protein
VKKLLAIGFFYCLVLTAEGQQHALYSQYLFNLYAINPAYAGERNALSTAVSYRAQWVGFEGAPSTANFAAHTPVFNRSFAAGVWFQNDRVGAREHSSFRFTASYKIRFAEGKRLSFALNGGALNHRYNWSELSFPNGSDPVAFETERNTWRPAFDFGILYLTNSSYVGVSVLNLNAVDLSESTVVDSRLEPNLNVMAGHVFEISRKIDLKPSAFLRATAGETWQFDANLSVRFDNTLWFTTTYRYDFGMVFSAHFYVNDRLHMGYSYDLPTNELLSQQSGTHEIFVGYDFNLISRDKYTPRNF